MMKYLSIAILVLVGILGCKSKTVLQDRVVKENAIQVDMAGKMEPARLISSFPRFGLKHLCKVDGEKNIHIFQFDETYIDKTEILSFLGNEVGVESCVESKGCGFLD